MFKKIIQKLLGIFKTDDTLIKVTFKSNEGRVRKGMVVKPIEDGKRFHYIVTDSYNTIIKRGYKIYPLYKDGRFDGSKYVMYAYIFDDKGNKLKGYYNFKDIQIN